MRYIVVAAAALAFSTAGVVAQDQRQPLPGVAGQANPAATPAISSEDFVMRAAISNQFETESSQLALERGQSDQIKTFAQRMIEDHTAADERLREVAATARLDGSISTELDEAHRAQIDQLGQAQGAEFDVLYVQLQRQAHDEAVTLFDTYAQSGDDETLRTFAAETLPTLQEHHEMVMALEQGIQTAQQPVAAAQQPAQPGQQAAQPGAAQGGEIVVTQPAPTIQVETPQPEVLVTQGQPQVNIQQAEPEILVRQAEPVVRIEVPQPIVTIDIPQPEIIVRMPEPTVAVNTPQPQIEVRQAEPTIRVEQAQPQVQLQAAQQQPVVQMEQQQQAQVTLEQAQPRVTFEAAEPRVEFAPAGEPQVVINRTGEPNVIVERLGDANQQAAAGQPPADQQQRPAGEQQQAQIAGGAQQQGATCDMLVAFVRENPNGGVTVQQAEQLLQARDNAACAEMLTAARTNAGAQQPNQMAAAPAPEQAQQQAQLQAPAAGQTPAPAAGAELSAGNRQAFTVEDIRDMDIVGANGEEIGEVDRVITYNDRIYAVVGQGGFLGLGERAVPLPLESLRYNGEDLVLPTMTAEEIENIRAIDANNFVELPNDMSTEILVE